jgi:rod shape-determining protein MreC
MSAGWLNKPPSNAARLFFFFLLSVSLMVVDHRSHYLQTIRSALAVVVYPIQIAALLPVKAGSGAVALFQGRESLRAENEQLRREQLLYQARLEKLDALEVENARLRRLLDAAVSVADRAVVAELLEVSLEPFTQKILVNKGATDGVYLGQPVIDAEGVMGQITQVTPFTSTATLITDPSHAIPVQVRRNGLRAILFGNGSRTALDLPHLTPLSDIQEGDVLITSGMGGRFPVGYPVARVVRVVRDPNEPFLAIEATPVAKLDHSKEVLLIWSGQAEPAPGEVDQ